MMRQGVASAPKLHCQATHSYMGSLISIRYQSGAVRAHNGIGDAFRLEAFLVKKFCFYSQSKRPPIARRQRLRSLS